MARVKPSNERLEKMLRRQIGLRAQIESCRVMEEGKNSKFWKTIQGMVQSKMDEIEVQLDSFLESTPDKRLALLQSRQDHKFFHSLANDFAASRQQFEKALAKLGLEIEEYRAKIKKYGI